MRILQYKVERILGLAEPISSYDELKMFIYDGHDANIIPLLGWLNASNVATLQEVEFAS